MSNEIVRFMEGISQCTLAGFRGQLIARVGKGYACAVGDAVEDASTLVYPLADADDGLTRESRRKKRHTKIESGEVTFLGTLFGVPLHVEAGYARDRVTLLTEDSHGMVSAALDVGEPSEEAVARWSRRTA